MAHVGKFYKLHFRRDLCLGCIQNNRAWPEAFRSDASIAPQQPQQPTIIIPPTLVLPVGDQTSSDLRWKSDAIMILGRPCTIRIEFAGFDLPLQRVKILWEIWDATHRVAHKEITNETPGQCDRFFLDAGFPRPLVNDHPAWWGSQDLLASGVSRGAIWAEYP